MSRKHKSIIRNGIDIRDVGYYSTPKFIANFLTSELLSYNPRGEYVLDPAVGKEELLEDFFNAGKKIDSFDIIQHKKNYEFSSFHHEDFIEYFINTNSAGLFRLEEKNYDYIIANPPYNCHEIDYIHKNKKHLLEAFPVGVYNMYSIFLSAIIDTAKKGCLIGLIISDSFLTANAHSQLRKKILNSCSIHALILCPTSLFRDQKADVRTCILILQKGIEFQGLVKVKNRLSTVDEFKYCLSKKDYEYVSLESIILPNKNALPFIVGVHKCFITLLNNNKALGSLYPCVTCISTGNDKKYLSTTQREGFSVPFYKNPGKRKFKSDPNAFLIDSYIEESYKEKDFMVRNKQYIDSPGIACSSMGLPFSAVFLPQNAVTGVNAAIFPPINDIYWLLAYLNSSLITFIVRGVINRSNMVTSGYVSSIPVIEFTIDEKEKLANIAKRVITDDLLEADAINIIDEIVFTRAGVHLAERKHVLEFCNNIYTMV